MHRIALFAFPDLQQEPVIGFFGYNILVFGKCHFHHYSVSSMSWFVFSDFSRSLFINPSNAQIAMRDIACGIHVKEGQK